MKGKATLDFDPGLARPVVAPWPERHDWAEGRVVHSERATARGIALYCFVISLMGFAWPVVGLLAIAGLIPLPFQARLTVEAILHLVPQLIFGLIFVGIGLFYVVRWRTSAGSLFQMAEVPGRIGGTLTGVVRVAWKLDAAAGMLAKLECMHQVITGSGRGRRTSLTTRGPLRSLRNPSRRIAAGPLIT